MDKITDEIYIGNWSEVNTNPEVKSYLNVAIDLDNPKIEGIDKIGLIDGPGNPKDVIFKIIDKMEQLIDFYGNVMIFCHEGKSRSVISVLAFLHIKRGMSIGKAYHFIREHRDCIRIMPYLSVMLFELLGRKYFL